MTQQKDEVIENDESPITQQERDVMKRMVDEYDAGHGVDVITFDLESNPATGNLIIVQQVPSGIWQGTLRRKAVTDGM